MSIIFIKYVNLPIFPAGSADFQGVVENPHQRVILSGVSYLPQSYYRIKSTMMANNERSEESLASKPSFFNNSFQIGFSILHSAIYALKYSPVDIPKAESPLCKTIP